jgi:hypothetical protein
MNKEQQEIIDEAYENYCKEYENGTHLIGTGLLWMAKETKGTFVYRSKTDLEFSEKWGLKIEERDLSFEERQERCPVWTKDSYGMDGELRSPITIDWDKTPTKLITITYNDKTIESYE